MSHIVEAVLFRLKPDVSEAQFVSAAQATFGLLAGYPGYLRRELVRSEDGLWLDIVHWADLATAQAAATIIMSDPIGQAFGALIDESTMQFNHYTPLLTS